MYVKESEVVKGARFDYFGHTVECTGAPRTIAGGAVIADFVAVEGYPRYCLFTDTIKNLSHLADRS